MTFPARTCPEIRAVGGYSVPLCKALIAPRREYLADAIIPHKWKPEIFTRTTPVTDSQHPNPPRKSSFLLRDSAE